MNKDKIMGYIRHALTFAGGYLAGRGLLPEGQIDEMVAALVTIIGLVWSGVSKNKPQA